MPKPTNNGIYYSMKKFWKMFFLNYLVKNHCKLLFPVYELKYNSSGKLVKLGVNLKPNHMKNRVTVNIEKMTFSIKLIHFTIERVNNPRRSMQYIWEQ